MPRLTLRSRNDGARAPLAQLMVEENTRRTRAANCDRLLPRAASKFQRDCTALCITLASGVAA
eukprot:3421970-Lingulodinium_polyedra.AAC.1